MKKSVGCCGLQKGDGQIEKVHDVESGKDLVFLVLLHSRIAKGLEKNFLRGSIGLVTFAPIAQRAKFVKILFFG